MIMLFSRLPKQKVLRAFIQNCIYEDKNSTPDVAAHINTKKWCENFGKIKGHQIIVYPQSFTGTVPIYLKETFQPD
jgi:hypothetical protein